MANVTGAKRVRDLPQSGSDRWDPSNRITTREYTRTYQATTDTATTDEQIILNSSYVPQMFEADLLNPDAGVIGRTARRTQSDTLWEVEVTYSTAAPSQQDGDDGSSPGGRKVIWDIRTEPIQLPMWRDVNGDPVLLSNRLPPNPPLMVTRFLTVWTAKRNETVYPVTIMRSYNGRVNSDNFLGCDPGTLMLKIPTAPENYLGQTKYWEVTYEFTHNPLGWQPVLLNAGYMGLFDTGGFNPKRKHITDENGQDVTQPHPLDANGTPLTALQVSQGTGLTYTTVTGYESVAFSSIGLTLP